MAEQKDGANPPPESVVEENVVNPAHEVNENPEEHLGAEMPDPWDDEAQTDWPNGSVDVPEVNS